MPPPIAFLKDVQSAIAQGSFARRAEILRHVTDLFVDQHPQYSQAEIEVFDEVISLLALEIETSAKVLLASRLAPIPNAPTNIIRKLAAEDTIEVAWPVLAHSPRLDEATLVELACTKSQQHLLAIARRKTLPANVTDVLIARGERPVLAGLSSNTGAAFSDDGYATLAEKINGDQDLIVRLGTRADIPRPIFLKLMSRASDLARAKLRAAHPDKAAAVDAAVAESTERLQTGTRQESPRFTAAQDSVEALHDSGRLRDTDVEGFAKAKHFERTVVALALLCDLDIGMVERAMMHEQAETILVFVKAAGLSWGTARAVLLMRAGEAGISASDLDQNLASFERLKPATAQELVRFYRLKEAAMFSRRASQTATPAPASTSPAAPQKKQ
jgi:uncharacterized protein (DUF2336 family)